jgi:16S rRNA A1518/A1519 N6-dimethyltransferase RsmA/KsgA/DIM1 with predicted DNA glycosylase/AP lyase activity
MKLADLMNMCIKVSQNVCTLTLVVPPNLFSPTPSTSSAIKTPKNTQDPDYPEPADEGDIQMEYSSD